MLDGYLQWVEETGIDQHIEVVATETYVEVPLTVLGTDVKLIGKLDARIVNTLTGSHTFMDHKTVASLEEPTLGLNQQVLHYMVIEFLQNGLTSDVKPIDGALYNMLRRSKRTVRAKPPFYARVMVHHNEHEIENYRWQLVGTILSMLRAERQLDDDRAPHQAAVPSRPSRDCAWKCDFFKICRMFDDGSRVEDAVRDMYEVRNPLDYYGGMEKQSE